MHNRTPRIAEAEFTDELASVVSGARRRASRGGDRHVDTAHLLHSLIESDFQVREAFGDGARLARVLGYLVQRSIGYGLRWQGAVEDSGALPVSGEPDEDGWSPSAAAAMEDARSCAAQRGEPRVGCLDLLAALAADRECRAVDVLARAGVDTGWLADRTADRIAGSSRQV